MKILKIFCFLTIFLLLTPPAFAKGPKVGDPAPGFSLISVDGQSVSLAELKGKVVLIGLFHICVPCMNQAREFNKVRKELDPEKVVILGINTSGDSRKDVMDYLSKFPEKVQFPYLLDPDQSLHQAYEQRDMPTVLVIDREGVIRARAASVGADQLTPFIQKLL